MTSNFFSIPRPVCLESAHPSPIPISTKEAEPLPIRPNQPANLATFTPLQITLPTNGQDDLNTKKEFLKSLLKIPQRPVFLSLG